MPTRHCASRGRLNSIRVDITELGNVYIINSAHMDMIELNEALLYVTADVGESKQREQVLNKIQQVYSLRFIQKTNGGVREKITQRKSRELRSQCLAHGF